MQGRIGEKNRSKQQGIDLGVQLNGIVDNGSQPDFPFDHDQGAATGDRHLSHGIADFFDRFLLCLLMGMGKE